MRNLIGIYRTLFDEYGPQGWWPTTKPGETVPHYSGGPRNERQQVEVIVGTILTQNTSWKNVEKAFVQLQKNKLVAVKPLSLIGLSVLAKLIRPSGYFNQKAKRLQTIARFFSQRGIKKFFSTADTALLRTELLALNGVGPETADSMLLYAGNHPSFVIDAYTRRIFSRIGFLSESATYDAWQRLFHASLPRDSPLFNEFHALIVEHAKRHCRKRPVCGGCPLKDGCRYPKDLSNNQFKDNS